MTKLFLPVLLFACLVIYLPYLDNGFVFDDRVLVENNPFIKSSSLLPDVFTSGIYDYWTGPQPYDRMYRPIQMLSYFLDYSLWGPGPAGFRLTNILLHFVNSALVFFLIISLFGSRPLACLSSALFMAHPVNISSVAYISARGDLLSAFFILASCAFFIKFLNKKNIFIYLLSICSAGLALLSRENAMLITVFLFLICLVKRDKAGFKYLAAFVILSAGYLVLRLFVFGASGLSTHPDYLRALPAVFNFLNISWRYLILLFWPVDLRLFHTAGVIGKMNIPVLLLCVAIAALAVSVIIKWKKKAPLSVFGFGLLWFLAGLIPVYFYFDAYPGLGEALMAESWLYLSDMGFSVALAGLCLSGRVLKPFLIVYILVLAAIVPANAGYWRNEAAFYERTLEFLPEPSAILRNLVSAYIEAGDMEHALAAIKRLEKHYPDTPAADILYGQYYYAAGLPSKALGYYKKIAAGSFFTNYSVSLCYADLKEYGKAIEFSHASFSQNPFFQKNILHLARLYRQAGEETQASRYMEMARKLDPKGRYELP